MLKQYIFPTIRKKKTAKMKVHIMGLWAVCLVSSMTDWLEVASERPAYVPGRPMDNLKEFAQECVAREVGIVKPIKWIKMLDLRQVINLSIILQRCKPLEFEMDETKIYIIVASFWRKP